MRIKPFLDIISCDVKQRWIQKFSYVRRFVVSCCMFMTDLQAEMAPECSRATAVAAHGVSWMLWKYVYVVYVMQCFMFSFFNIFRALGGTHASKSDRLRIDIVT